MGRIGWGEILVIGLVVIVLFGAKRLPEIGSALGKAIREFKKASKEDNSTHISSDEKKS
jgi:sec-independent protein translocase protein TatA